MTRAPSSWRNKTAHTVAHLAWVPIDNGAYELRMAALVKPNGLFGRLYMAGIEPFRHLSVYPVDPAMGTRVARAG